MIFGNPPLQTSIEKVLYKKIQPISQISGPSPIAFVLPPQNSLHFIDLKKSFMRDKARLRHGDGRTLTPTELCGPLNLLIHSLFDKTVQGHHIIPLSTHYPHKAMLEIMTKHCSDSESSQLVKDGYATPLSM